MKKYLPLLIFCFLYQSINAIEYTGNRANSIIPGAVVVRTTEKNDFPMYFLFQKGKEIPISKFPLWMNAFIKNPKKVSFKLISKHSDKIGYTHLKYQQVYDNMPIDKAVFILHTKDDMVCSFSGNLFVNVDLEPKKVLVPEQIINLAKSEMNAVSYKWEFPSEEIQLKKETGNPASTYYPQPEFLIYSPTEKNFCLAYRVTLYSQKPIDKKEFIIDASTGKVLTVRQKLYFTDVPGTAVTKYSGTQTITTDNSISGSYRLREVGRGQGIETYNMNEGTNYTSATDFTDTDNNWNNVNAQQDEVATDAHWGTEKTYDYYYTFHNQNSIDGNGFKLISYVHFDVQYSNAFWDGYRMTYGDGGGSSPFTALDVCAHEITHGLDEYTAALIYQDQSGALNEGYSDIFGAAIEFYAKPTDANWTMGEDLGTPFRSMINPNAYGDPDTYLGTNWYTGTADYGGVHSNCTVLSHWFYLLSEGGSGTNDIGHAYVVNGIGMDNAAEVAFRTLTEYLFPDATYDDARFFSIVSAIDIFGPCTQEVEAVTNAMYAVGVGSAYIPTVVADFSSPFTSACMAPLTVNFQNTSSNSTSFLWNFGDGNTSTDVNPSHTFNLPGNYNVSLIANGGACGIDTTIKNGFISIDAANPCVVVMPLSGTGTMQTSCSGTVYDGGGPTGNYADMSDAIITISPTGATNVTINFLTFDIEPGDNGSCNYDYIELFDGANTSAASLGRYCNLNGSPGTVTSTGGSITILLHSDQALNLSGFMADWSCSLANTAPIANFSSAPASTCTGMVSFTDNSTNGPTSWLWNFGDGNTSTVQNPQHIYTTNGIFNVSLTATNTYGSNTITLTNLINVNTPLDPVVISDTICPNEQAVLTATGNGTIKWYTLLNGGISIFTGSTFTTPNLASTMVYFAENLISSASLYVGDTRSSSGGGYLSSSTAHYLVFDCLTPCKLVSVEVNASGAGTRVIQLKNAGGTILDARSINIPDSVSRITLNFDLPAESNLQLVGPSNANLWRNDVNCSYPYQLSNLISIKSSSAASRYYYFYDWEVKEPDCISSRIPDTAYVNVCQKIEESKLFDLNIYPNPTNDLLFINFNTKVEIKSVSICDLIGKETQLKYSTIDDSVIELDLRNYSEGIYFIKITTDQGTIKQKILKN